MSNIPPTLPIAPQPGGAAPALGVVPAPPTGIARLAAGTIIDGTVIGRTGQGLVAVETSHGELAVRTAANLPPKAHVVLQLQPTGSQLRVILLSVEPAGAAARPAAGRQPPSPSATNPPAPNAPAPHLRAPNAPSPNAPAGNAPAQAASAARAPAGTAPAPSAPAPNAPALNAPAPSAPPGSAPAGSAPAGSAPAGTAPAPNAPPSHASAGAAPSPSVPGSSAPASNAPAANAPTVSTTPTNAPAPNAPVPGGPAPGGPTQAPAATDQAAIRSAAPAVQSGQSASTSASPGAAAAGAAPGSQAAGTAPPAGPAPATATPAGAAPAGAPGPATPTPTGGAASGPSGAPLAGAPGASASGAAVIAAQAQSGAGPTPATSTPTPAGPVAHPAGGALSIRSWPALAEAVASVRLAASGLSQAVVEAVVPRPGPGLPGALVLLLSALRGGDIRGWLGEETMREIARLKGPGAAQRLADDFSQLARLTRAETGDWRVYALPFFDGDEAHQIQLYVKRRDQGGGAGDEEAPARFVFEVALSQLGRVQLDGLAARGRFDLVVRSQADLPGDIRNEIGALFAGVRDGAGFTGEVHFQTVGDFPVAPLKDLHLSDTGVVV